MNSSLGVQLFPYPFRHPATDLPLALGTVTTTLAGTATLVPTFADAALTAPNPNPLALDASGYGQMFFSPLNGGTAGVSYDVVVKDQAGVVQWIFEDVSVPVPTAGGNATSLVIGAGPATTLTIAGGAITPTKNVHLVAPEGGAADFLDSISIAQFPDGGRLTISNTSGAAPITVRNGVANIFTQDGVNVVLSSTAQKLSLIRQGANFWVDSAIITLTSQTNFAASGRLTLQSGVPVPTVDVPVATSVFYTPYTGNVIDLYSGSDWRRFTFNEISLSLAPVAANKVIDLFAFNNAGVVTLSSTEWTNVNTRNQALTRQDGVLVLASNPSARYLGTLATSSTTAGQSSDALNSRMVWNYYNRVRRPLRKTDATGQWSYNQAIWRIANSPALNFVFVTVGINEDPIDLTVYSRCTQVSGGGFMGVAIGQDALTPTTGSMAQGGLTPASQIALTARLVALTPIGRTAYYWLEIADASGATFDGTLGYFVSGITGHVVG